MDGVPRHLLKKETETAKWGKEDRAGVKQGIRESVKVR